MGALGVLVRSVRREAGLTQGELARRAGVTQQWLSRLEGGSARAESQKVLDTLSALGARVAVLTDDDTTASLVARRPLPPPADDDPFADVTERL